MSMTIEAKSHLAKTIRNLRSYLLERLYQATSSVYQLQIPDIENAQLPRDNYIKRKRLESWLDEQVRAQNVVAKEQPKLRKRFLEDAIKKKAYTHVNRHVYLRLLEGFALRQKLLTGGWNSKSFQDFQYFIPQLQKDDSEGYAFVLELVYDELATELPGLFGRGGIEELIPLPIADLRHLVTELDSSELRCCWSDDMTLGWVYQFWNDPEKELIDAKINSGGKVENHEIAAKTQLFTERYMVDWLLQNSLGAKWLAICKKNNWQAQVIADGTLENLQQRRAQWREKRDSNEVSLTDLMPLHNDNERNWVYYVEQEISTQDAEHAPQSIRDIKILDPACGSGHFLVIAMDLLFALYKEEAQHRGCENDKEWSEKHIVERILSANLHGIDIDPRAVQIAAAALMLKAKILHQNATPQTLNIVASQLNLSGLTNDDPAIVELKKKIAKETAIPQELTQTIIDALNNADYLGTLLQINEQIEHLIVEHVQKIDFHPDEQLLLFDTPTQQKVKVDFGKAKRVLLRRLQEFLSKHTRGNDLGLHLRGRQLAVGLRFLQINKENHYDIVVGNPPYQGTGKMKDKKYIEKTYPEGKPDLYSCFTMRALQLCKPSGLSSLLTMRGWMFITSYAKFRAWLLEGHTLSKLGDLDQGAFSQIGGHVVTAVMAITKNMQPDLENYKSIMLRATPEDVSGKDLVTKKICGLQCQSQTFQCDIEKLKGIEGWPVIYWWDQNFLEKYLSVCTLSTISPGKKGLCTGNDARFHRLSFEVSVSNLSIIWFPTVKGSRGIVWFEPWWYSQKWQHNGLEQKVFNTTSSGCAIRNEKFYFVKGIAFSMIGANFSARIHFYPSIFGNMGSSVFTNKLQEVLCLMNSKTAKYIMQSINPGVHFEVGDVNRLPMFEIDSSEEIYNTIEKAFAEYESHREPSVEFKTPGPSCWNYAQEWAQQSVDRPENTLLPEYNPIYEDSPATDHISYALGIALGRFHPDGKGIINPNKDDLSHALPNGLLFLNGTLKNNDLSDSLGEDTCKILHSTWKEHQQHLSGKNTDNIRNYLRERFFKDVHLNMYEKRPIHWPLSSQNKTFVAWVNIHRMNKDTLRNLRAFHLEPAKERLQKHLDALQETRASEDTDKAKKAEKEYTTTQQQLQELEDFITSVKQCGEQGAPPVDGKCTAREVDAVYDPNLDDGVMINSAALWPLLHPQWKDPQKWWKELANAKGKKDYDWAHLAKKYWPQRVDGKCKEDPSLAVAHGCFWKYHPAKAWEWELRLQQEIGNEFVIEENDSDNARNTYFDAHGEQAIATLHKEVLRRESKVGTQRDITLNRSGLWTQYAQQMWALEGDLSEKLFTQREKKAKGTEEEIHKELFCIYAPDRENAVEKLLHEHPQLLPQRQQAFAQTGDLF